MGMFVTTDMREEEKEASTNPMLVDGCLVDFTRPKFLSAKNGWKCPHCASKLVNESNNLENKAIKED